MSTVNASLPLTVSPPAGGSLLEDFASLRLNGDGTPLWFAYTGENDPQVISLENGTLKDVCSNGGTNAGIYLDFFPRSGGYPFPAGYAQSFIKSGAWNSGYNRLRWWAKPSKAITRRSDGGDIIQVGTYIKPHNEPDVAWQGDHFYHLLDPNFYANRWHLFELNRVPQHQVGENPSQNWPENPNGIPYFDGLTIFYFDSQGSAFKNMTWWMDDFAFAQVVGEPDTLVSSICAVYSGTKYEVSWASPKNVNQPYDVYTKTTSMKPGGVATGTLRGTVSNPGSAYTGCVWSWTTAEVPDLFVAIKPQGQSLFTEIRLQPRV